jgi:hypothetical protein
VGETNDLDQSEEDILTYTISDEALESAASTENVPPTPQVSLFAKQCC